VSLASWDPRRRPRLLACVLALAAAAIPAGASGRASARNPGVTATLPDAVAALPHDIPSDVTVQAFIRPEGRRLTFLVRVPLEAMRDFEWPLVGDGYLDIAAAGPSLRDAASMWLGDYVRFFEEGRDLGDPELLAVRVSLPSSRAFAGFEEALAHVRSAPLPASTRIPWQQALLDVLFEYDIGDETARFSIDPGFAHLGLRTVTVLRFLPPDRGERIFEYVGDPGLVRLDPSWLQAARRFVALGIRHILDGVDHLLFLLCLVIPIRRVRALVPVVTSFTIAHSITLIASASGLAPSALWFPPLIETLIALSIVWMAFENIVGAGLGHRWALAFGFGLVHGFGFSFALRETLQFAGRHLLTSLLAFNIGVEIGQLLVVAATVPALIWAFARVRERIATILLSAVVAHTAWHWMTERGTTLLQYEFRWPALDAAFAAALMRWALLALIVGGTAWIIRRPFARWLAKGDPAAEPTPSG